MARLFASASSNLLTTAIGALQFAPNAAGLSIVAIARLATLPGRMRIATVTSTGSHEYGLWVHSVNGELALYGGAAGLPRSGTGFLTTGTWYLLGATITGAGSQTPRLHKYDYAAGTATHVNATFAVSIGLPTDTPAVHRIGGGPSSEFWNGDIAAVAYWDGGFTDQQFEALAFSLNAWWQAQPKGIWLLDQAATGQAVNDFSGNGANQTALVGTSVSAGSVPVFSYGSPVLEALSEVAAGVAYQEDLAGSETPAGSLANEVRVTLAGSVTPAGALVDKTRNTLAGTVTPTGSLSLKVKVALTGSVLGGTYGSGSYGSGTYGGHDPVGSLSLERTQLLSVSGLATPAGSLVNKARVTLAGLVTPAGSLVQKVRVAVAGSVTPAGSLSFEQATILASSGLVTPAGSLVNKVRFALAGSVTAAGTVALKVAKLLEGTVTPVGTLVSQNIFSGSVAPEGTVSLRTRKTLSGAIDTSSKYCWGYYLDPLSATALTTTALGDGGLSLTPLTDDVLPDLLSLGSETLAMVNLTPVGIDLGELLICQTDPIEGLAPVIVQEHAEAGSVSLSGSLLLGTRTSLSGTVTPET